ncbi:MAG: YihY/virulence factor BrkB family protein [Deltaproteobacteria bacterium]|nr:YihY/virulence factor BrkB family protein [Deltaproteobacteria bacterium]
MTRLRRARAALGVAARACWAGLRTSARMIRDGGRIYLDAHAFDHAASISFFTLLSVTPFLILVASAAGYLAVMFGPEYTAGIVGEITGTFQGFMPAVGDEIRSIVSALIENRGRFGLVGGVVMLLGASMVFGALEHATSEVFGTGSKRRFIVSRAVFSVLLIASGAAVFLLHYAMTIADSFMLAWQGQTFDQWARESPALDAALTWIPVPIGFLAALYGPGIVRVRPGPALAGAAVFFLLWEVAREVYSYYVTNVAQYGVLYGSLATPILLILWTFYSANILLFAFACVAALTTRPTGPGGRDASRPN